MDSVQELALGRDGAGAEAGVPCPSQVCLTTYRGSRNPGPAGELWPGLALTTPGLWGPVETGWLLRPHPPPRSPESQAWGGTRGRRHSASTLLLGHETGCHPVPSTAGRWKPAGNKTGVLSRALRLVLPPPLPRPSSFRKPASAYAAGLPGCSGTPCAPSPDHSECLHLGPGLSARRDTP